MKKIKSIYGAICLSIIICVQMLGMNPVSATVNGTKATDIQENSITDNTLGNIIYMKGDYWTTTLITYEDEHQEIGILASADGVNWVIYSNILVESPLNQVELNLVKLGDTAILYLNDGLMSYVYTSESLLFWDLHILETGKITDIEYANNSFWILDSLGGIYQTADFKQVSYYTSMESLEPGVVPADFIVQKDRIIISTYQTKWGQKNQSNGLLIYDRQKNSWSTATGITNEKGLICELATVNNEFILVISDPSRGTQSVFLYTSQDGMNWAESTDYPAAIRQLWTKTETDSGILLMIKKLNFQIYSNSAHMIPVPVDMYMKGELWNIGSSGVFYGGKMMVSVRDFFTALGGSVQWNGETRQIECFLGGDVIVFDLKNNTCVKNNVPLKLSAGVVSLDGKSMMPLRDIAENLGYQVVWDPINITVNLN